MTRALHHPETTDRSGDRRDPGGHPAGIAASQNGWAKAPDFEGDPERASAVHRATARDREHYLRGGMTEIECRACHACVMVKKTSPFHTSVQWNPDARARCGELEQIRRDGGNTAMMPTCPGCPRASTTASPRASFRPNHRTPIPTATGDAR